MIPVQRLPATDAMTKLCDFRTKKIQDAGATGKAADEQWKDARAARRHIKGLLERMAPGRIRCMYCLDNQEPTSTTSSRSLVPRFGPFVGTTICWPALTATATRNVTSFLVTPRRALACSSTRL